MTVDVLNPIEVSYRVGRVANSISSVLHDCNSFYVTLGDGTDKASYSLRRVEIAFDHDKNRLRLEIYPM